MKKIAVTLLLGLILATVLTGCGKQESISNQTEPENKQIAEETISEQEDVKLNIQIGDTKLTATPEDNESVDAFKELLKNGGLSIQFLEYGGFEQVGSIGISLPRNDVQTTTSAGDIVLYSGNQLVMFYGSNSWAYTRIGKIDSIEDLQNILGKGDITATFTLAE
ncbi:cyclophilin-like fold protein [Eubacterium barkeri]|uniref:Cyclophilin-like domain-containing protein n=1 Tax=Eubacterium barkeri TaxID=1528 RepID=A0A1H3BRP5_EUBBA|nr:cyclophilin-like fold protein [Eubacterium barkeri]SDX44408.1 hypothetical protein SAMN04488579_102177 [Eubacterium barkeri]